MPLNYSKWDSLEVSDDSDIEGHPNVDHKSLVRWKQRDIHEKRAQRNAHIAQLHAEIACNDVLLPRLTSIVSDLSSAGSGGPSYFSSLVERLRTNPAPDAPESNAPRKVTYDEMILALLMKVSEEAKAKGEGEGEMGERLVESLKVHVGRLGEETEKLREELKKEEAEKAKKITSESIHEGWDSHYVPPKPEPKSVYKGATKTEKKTDIEVLNPKSVEQAQVASLASQNSPSAPPTTTTPSTSADTKADDDDELPEMTPVLEEFSHLPLKGYEQSFHFIQSHRDVYVPGASDALLISAFTAERDGHHSYAKQCVHQSLLLQYCEKLGPDGVGLFFKRMMSGDPRADKVFSKDVEDTYEHIKTRVTATASERTGLEPEEQIQLVPESAGSTISFNIPDGPPPPNLTLEGPGTEGLDVEQVRRALQLRWDVFSGFPEDLQDALREQSLEGVNRVLAGMKVQEAERIVEMLDNGGILNFADGGIRDETGRAAAGAKEEEEEEDEGEDEYEGAGDELDGEEEEETKQTTKET